ncbi:DUF1127 domain-containing protein [Tateyamaria omphalii]|uniref:YjiS-like domain-containing protein n=1 Tax=Tateyamaria omphalii TaxID=299262 RepID=A0A1P8MS90_9RHOB|nr:DUF1127 domain-containing protein [Tateyamaria omphalii]APX10946.1 hypothetical protein BWR18_04000 [Tateyamaria omphalii]
MAFTDVSTRPAAAKPAARHHFSLRTLLNVWRSRRALARLDARALDDIGVDATLAARESAKPVWDVPATWRA